MNSERVVERARANNVYLYELAEDFGISASALSKKLRRGIDKAERDYMCSIIDDIAKGRGTYVYS